MLRCAEVSPRKRIVCSAQSTDLLLGFEVEDIVVKGPSGKTPPVPRHAEEETWQEEKLSL